MVTVDGLIAQTHAAMMRCLMGESSTNGMCHCQLVISQISSGKAPSSIFIGEGMFMPVKQSRRAQLHSETVKLR